MKKFLLIFGGIWMLSAGIDTISAQDVYPQVTPTAQYTTSTGEEIEDASDAQSAPLTARYQLEVTGLGDYTPHYEWRIYKSDNLDTPIIHRYDASLDYVFTQSGSFQIEYRVTLTHGTDTIVFPAEGETNPFLVSISESVLEMPNAFSPNGDGYNDIYKAKEGYKSIVSFKATIFNRWGQKLYSWSDLAGGWDGKVGGNVVKDGVYFVVVEARGADGRKYQIRRDVNVLTTYSGTAGNSSSGN